MTARGCNWLPHLTLGYLLVADTPTHPALLLTILAAKTMIMCQYAKRRFTRKLKQLNCIIKNILLLRQLPAAKQIECHEGNKWPGNKQPLPLPLPQPQTKLESEPSPQSQRVCNSAAWRLSLSSLTLWAGSKNAPRTACWQRTMQKRGRQSREAQSMSHSVTNRPWAANNVTNNCQHGEFYRSTWRIINTLGQLPVAIRGIQNALGLRLD